MKIQTFSLGIATCVLAIGLVGCGDDNNDSSASGNPAPPALAATQIDRMGRAGVNTALTNPFYRESVAAEEMAHEEIVDDYNAATVAAEWKNLFTGEIAGNLAILDSLDTVCGNQLLASSTLAPNRYVALAGVLADDQLYVNTSSGACSQYLAVEANALGITNSDCGGRTPLHDTIDTTYSVLAAGALAGVTDGIPVDADGVASLNVFPFLAAPNA